ncbi:MAG: aminoacyl-tRNA hydrolase [Deltaproteobacteria bacterium]|jgi:PTH1 family peptidyl-tRNA hydrolase
MPEDSIKLIVGLGNPGAAYRFTRHNVGFMVTDQLAQRHRISFDNRKFKSVFGLGSMGDCRVILAKPMTFMNLSGPSVRDLARFFKLDKKHLLVIHDDIDLVFGKIKIKQKGGDGGHKGVMSLVEAFGSGAFVRIRVGIGRPDTREEVEGYVLNRFDAQQSAQLDRVIIMAQEAVETILLKGLREAMNRFHGKTISQRNVGRRL